MAKSTKKNGAKPAAEEKKATPAKKAPAKAPVAVAAKPAAEKAPVAAAPAKAPAAEKAPAAAKPVEAPKPAPAKKPGPRASVTFNAEWRVAVAGDLVPGAELTIDYAPQRALLRDAKKGWGVQAFAMFLPSGRVLEAPAVEAKQGAAKALPVTVEIPADASQLQLWFRHSDGGAEAWDSNFGHNYRFEVRR